MYVCVCVCVGGGDVVWGVCCLGGGCCMSADMSQGLLLEFGTFM